MALVQDISNILGLKKQLKYLKFSFDKGQPRFSLSLIHKILKKVSLGYRVDQVAGWVGWTNESVYKLIDCAREVSRISQYFPYQLDGVNHADLSDGDKIEAIKSEKRNLMGRYTNEPLVKHMSDLVEGDKGEADWLVDGLSLWKMGIKVREKGVYLSSLNEAKKYIMFLDGLGIDRLSVVNLVSKSFRSMDNCDDELQHWMDVLGINNYHYVDRSVEINLSSALRGYPIGIGVLEKDAAISQQQVLNFASYLSLCALGLKV